MYEPPYLLPEIPREHTFMGSGSFIRVTDEGDSPGYFEADGEVTSMKLYAFGNVAQLQANVSGQTNPGGVRVIKSGTTSILEVKGPRVHGSINDHAEINILSYVDGTSKIALELYDSSAKITLSDTTGAPVVSVNGPTYFDNTVNVTGTLTIANGSTSAVGLKFASNDADSGFYYSAATQIGLASDGHNAMISASGTGSSGSAAGTIATAAFDTNSTSGYQAVYRNNTYGTLARYTSNRADKDNIQSFSNSGAIIDALQPVTFVTKARDGESTADKAWREADIQHGFIAEDVADVADGKFASYDNVDGSLVPNGWRQPDMISLIVAELKSIRQRLVALES